MLLEPLRTPNIECLACTVKRRHSADELLKFHPLTGHGVNGKGACVCKKAECPYSNRLENTTR